MSNITQGGLIKTGGNTFGVAARIGTNDAFSLELETNNILALTIDSSQRVGVGGAPDSTSLLDLTSTTKGFLAPRMTTAQRDAIAAPATGLLVYNTTTSLFNYYDGVAMAWIAVDSGTGDWNILGNTGTVAGTNFLGTTDANALVFKTNNTEWIRILSTGNVGVGTATPGAKLELVGDGVANLGIILKKQSIDVGAEIRGEGNRMALLTNNVERVRIDELGNVGIGTSSPLSKLHLFGINTGLEIRGTDSGDNEIVYQIGQVDGSGAYVSLRNEAQTETIKLSTFGDSWFTGGNVGIGTSTPAYKLSVNASTLGTGIHTTSGADNGLFLMGLGGDGWAGNVHFNGTNWIPKATYGSIQAFSSGGGIWYQNSGLTIGVPYTPTERMRLDLSGNLGIGTIPTVKLDVATNTASNRAIYGSYYAADANGWLIVGRKSRNATVGSHTIVQNNDDLLFIEGHGSDGANFQTAGLITFAVDGTPGLNDMPGRITFWTTPDGSNVPVQRMRINNAGAILMGYSTATATGEVLGVQKNQNAGTSMMVTNTTSGTAARSFIGVSNSSTGSPGVYMISNSAGFTTSGMQVADAGTILSDKVAGLNVGTSNATVLSFWTNNVERMRIDNAGLVGIGTTTPGTILDIFAATNGALRLTRNETTANSQFLTIRKSNGTFAAPTIVANGDGIATISMQGYDGAAYLPVATIKADVDGVPGLNDMPGRLVFSTTADGASVTTERMRIDSAGNVGIGITPTTRLHVLAATGTNAVKIVGGGITTGYALQVHNNTGGGNLLMVQDNGKVGIGVSSPGSDLEIRDSTVGAPMFSLFQPTWNNQFRAYYSDAAGNLTFEHGGNPIWNIYANGRTELKGFTTSYALSVGGVDALNTSYALKVAGNGLTKFQISNAGRIGLGNTTSSPTAQFDLIADATLNAMKITGGGATSATFGLQVHDNTGTNNALMVRDDGNVGIGTNAPGAKLHVNGSQAVKTTASVAGAYTVLITDYIISKTGITGGGDIVTLPTLASAAVGQIFIITDESGTAGTNNITVDGNGAELIDGAATVLINVNYGVLRIYKNSGGGQWKSF